MDESVGTVTTQQGTDFAAEFEFTPLPPSEEADAEEQLLIVGSVCCR